MISKIHIKNFKSIKDQTIELKPINILVGQNGAGKSNFLSLFEFLHDLINRKLNSNGDEDGYFFKNRGISKVIYKNSSQFFEVKIEDENKSFYAIKINRNDNDDIRIGNEEIKTLQTENSLILSKSDQIESKVIDFFKDYNHSKLYLESLELVRSFKYYKFSNTSQKSILRKAQFEPRKYILEENLSNLWPFLNYLKKEYNKSYNDILNTVRFVYPNFIDLEFIIASKELLDVIWHEKGNQEGYVSSQLSDGTLRFICITTILLMPSLEQMQIAGTPNVVIIDEIEIGLHPQAIHILAELIHKASNHKQIIIATQSVELINKFKPEDLIIVDKITKKMPFGENGRDYEIGETVFSRLTGGEVKLTKAKIDFETWLDDYKLGQLWQSNMFGGNP